MTDMTSSVSAAQTDAENILAQTLAELQQISANIQREQVEIDRLKAEAQLIAAHTDTLLLRLRTQIDALPTAG